MHRDMDLIRLLLLKLEALDDPPSALVTFDAHDEAIAIEGYEPDQIDYHLSLIYEAGFIVSGKLEVARRQLGTALALYLEDLDPRSVHSLTS
jgi:hypothetical protein